MKLTDRIKLDKVPVFNSKDSTLEDYIKEINSYCVYFHNETKDFGFAITDLKEFFRFLVRNSSEPQYSLLRLIAYSKEQGMPSETVAEFFSLVEDLKEWQNKLIQVTHEKLVIRAVAESYYMDGLSTRQITETLIKLNILPEYNDKNNPIDHERTIARWVKSFKNHDVIVKPKKH